MERRGKKVSLSKTECICVNKESSPESVKEV